MNKRRAMTVLLPLLVAVPLTSGAAPAPAPSGDGAMTPPGDSAMAAVVTPSTVYPDVAPCTTGTGVHDFTVSGAGFQAGENLTVTVGAARYDDTVADDSGAYAATYRVRPLPAGSYRVDVRGDQGGRAVGGINLGYSACRSMKNGKLRLTGAGFTAADTINVLLDGSPGAVATATSGAGGEFDIRTGCAAGTHSVVIADTHDRLLSFAQFTC